MVQFDTRLPMMIQQPNILAAMDAGTTNAANQAALMRQAEVQNVFRQYGAGAMQGDPAALNALAGFDPGIAQGLQAGRLDMDATRQSMSFAAEEMQMLRDETARALATAQDQAAAAQEAAQVDAIATAAIRAHAAGDKVSFGKLTAELFNGQPLPFNDNGLGALAAVHEGAKTYVSSRPKPATPLVEVNTGNTGAPQPQIGTIPQGFSAVPDPTQPSGYRMERIAGGPEDTTKFDERAFSLARAASDTVITAAARARGAAKNQNFGSSGTTAVAALPIVGSFTDSGEVVRQIGVLKAQAVTGNLQAMREASPTGGALGAITAPELKLLEDKSGALDPNSPNFQRDLDDYERTLLRTIHGTEMGDRIFEETRGGQAATPAAPAPASDPLAGLSPEAQAAWQAYGQ